MLGPGDPSIEQHLQGLEELGARNMRAEGLEAAPFRSLDLRYAGQGYELAVEWSSDFVSRFHQLHEQRYGYADPQRPVEVVNARVRMIAATEQIPAARKEMRSGDGRNAMVKEKPIYFENRSDPGRVYDRARMQPGDRFDGPAVIVEYSATTYVPPGCNLYADEYENLIIEVSS
jgi:N-methylhydantoinase A